MKYFIISILFLLSLGYAGYYLYTYDKKGNAINKPESQVITPKKNPEYLTSEFWAKCNS